MSISLESAQGGEIITGDESASRNGAQTSGVDSNSNKAQGGDQEESIYLPDTQLNCVPLSEVCFRVIASSVSRILEVTETSRERGELSPEISRRKIIEYILNEREKFAKLLVLSRFSKYTKDQRIMTGFHVLLDEQNSLMAENPEMPMRSCSYMLFSCDLELNSLKFTNPFDLNSALEILLTGKPRTLPEDIKAILPQEELSVEEKETILMSMENSLAQCLSHLIIPQKIKNCIRIADGRLIIHVPDIYKICLEISGDAHPIKWKIRDFHLYLGVSDTEISGIYQGHFDKSTIEIKNNLQQILDCLARSEYKRVPIEETITKQDPIQVDKFYIKDVGVSTLLSRLIRRKKSPWQEVEEIKEPRESVKNTNCFFLCNPYTLTYIHYYLDNIYQQLKIESLYVCALNLNSINWKNMLQITMKESRKVLEIRYWIRHIKDKQHMDSICDSYVPKWENVTIFNVLRVKSSIIEPSIPETFNTWCNERFKGSSDTIFSNLMEISRTPNETAFRDLIASKILDRDVHPIHYLDVSHHIFTQSQSGTTTERESGYSLSSGQRLNTDKIDIERIIVNAVILETKRFFEKVQLASKACAIKCELSILKDFPDSIMINRRKELYLDVVQNENIPVIAKIIFCRDLFLYLMVNMHTGRVSIYSLDTYLTEESEHKYFENIFDTLFLEEQIVFEGLLKALQYKMIKDKLETITSMARLKTCKYIPFSAQEQSKISKLITNSSTFLMSKFNSDTLILISAASMEHWSKCFPDENNQSFNQEDVLYRIWSIKWHKSNNPNDTFMYIDKIECVHPEDIEPIEDSGIIMKIINSSYIKDKNVYWENIDHINLFKVCMFCCLTKVYADLNNEIQTMNLPLSYSYTSSLGERLVLDHNTPPDLLSRTNPCLVMETMFLPLLRSPNFADAEIMNYKSESPRWIFSEIKMRILLGNATYNKLGILVPNRSLVLDKNIVESPGIVVNFEGTVVPGLGINDTIIDKSEFGTMVYISKEKKLFFLLNQKPRKLSYIKFMILIYRQMSFLLCISDRETVNDAIRSGRKIVANPCPLRLNMFDMFSLVLVVYGEIQITISLSEELYKYLEENTLKTFDQRIKNIYKVSLELINLPKSPNSSITPFISNSLIVMKCSIERDINSYANISYAMSKISLLSGLLVFFIKNILKRTTLLSYLLVISQKEVAVFYRKIYKPLEICQVVGVNAYAIREMCPENMAKFSKTASKNACTRPFPYFRRSHQSEQGTEAGVTIFEVIKNVMSIIDPHQVPYIYRTSFCLVLESISLHNFIQALEFIFSRLDMQSLTVSQAEKNGKVKIKMMTATEVILFAGNRELHMYLDELVRFNVNFSEFQDEQNSGFTDRECILAANALLTKKLNECSLDSVKDLEMFTIDVLAAPSELALDIMRTLCLENPPVRGNLLFELVPSLPEEYQPISRSSINFSETTLVLVIRLFTPNGSDHIIIIIAYNYSTGAISRLHKMNAPNESTYQTKPFPGFLTAETTSKQPNSNSFGRLYPFINRICSVCANISDLREKLGLS